MEPLVLFDHLREVNTSSKACGSSCGVWMRSRLWAVLLWGVPGADPAKAMSNDPPKDHESRVYPGWMTFSGDPCIFGDPNYIPTVFFRRWPVDVLVGCYEPGLWPGLAAAVTGRRDLAS